MPPDVARYVLQLGFDPRDLERMHDLATRNQNGDLSPEEQDELRRYRQAGLQLDLLRAKATLSLKRHGRGP
jgi:hypothetical protein